MTKKMPWWINLSISIAPWAGIGIIFVMFMVAIVQVVNFLTLIPPLTILAGLVGAEILLGLALVGISVYQDYWGQRFALREQSQQNALKDIANPSQKHQIVEEKFEPLDRTVMRHITMLVMYLPIFLLIIAGWSISFAVVARERLIHDRVLLGAVITIPMLFVFYSNLWLHTRVGNIVNRMYGIISPKLATQVNVSPKLQPFNSFVPMPQPEPAPISKEESARSQSLESIIFRSTGIAIVVYIFCVYGGVAIALVLIRTAFPTLPTETMKWIQVGLLGLGLLGMFGVFTFVAKRAADNNPIIKEMIAIEKKMNDGEFEEATHAILDLVERIPNSDTRMGATMMLHGMGRLDDAEQIAREWLRDETQMYEITQSNERSFRVVQMVNALKTLGAILISKENYAEAITILQHAQSLNDNEPRLYTLFAESTLYRGNNPDLALDFLKRRYELQSKDKNLLLNSYYAFTAWAYAQKRDAANVEINLAKSLEFKADMSNLAKGEIYYYAGKVRQAQGKYDQAQEQFQKALALDSAGLVKLLVSREL